MCIKNRARISVWKDKIGIAMFKKKTNKPEFTFFEGWGKNFNVCSERMRYEFQCLKEKSQNYNARISNSNVWKNKIRISMLIETGIEYQYYLQGEDKNSNVYKNRARIPTFPRIRFIEIVSQCFGR